VVEVGTVLVATIGFTADFVMRRLYDLGRERVSKVVAVSLDVGDESSKRRIEQAYSVLSGFLAGIGLRSGLEWIRYGSGMISSGRDVILRALGEAGEEGTVDLFLTGGPRILVTVMTLSALTLPQEEASRVFITSYGEAFDARLSLNVGTIIALINNVIGRRVESSILREIRSRAGKNGVQPSELLEALGLPRSTLYKKLRELEEAGLIRRVEGGLGPL
jgi:CRISPR-associated protein Csa3